MRSRRHTSARRRVRPAPFRRRRAHGGPGIANVLSDLTPNKFHVGGHMGPTFAQPETEETVPDVPPHRATHAAARVRRRRHGRFGSRRRR
jgi:hypothetical protein